MSELTGKMRMAAETDYSMMVFGQDALLAGADALEAQESRIASLVKALEFYADVSKYPSPFTGGMGALWADCGEIARTALTPSLPK